jgi:hypothetical protein
MDVDLQKQASRGNICMPVDRIHVVQQGGTETLAMMSLMMDGDILTYLLR